METHSPRDLRAVIAKERPITSEVKTSRAPSRRRFPGGVECSTQSLEPAGSRDGGARTPAPGYVTSVSIQNQSLALAIMIMATVMTRSTIQTMRYP